MFSNLFQLSNILKTDERSWRGDKLFYHECVDGENMLKPGTVSFAPAWFELGHDVSAVLQ